MIEEIFSQVLANFNIAFIAIVNLLTYGTIKFIDWANGDRKVKVWTKRAVLVLTALIVATVYLYCGYEDKIILFNSAIIAPVSWSWILRPIIVKLKIGYKNADN